MNISEYHETPDCVGDWTQRMYLGTKCLVCNVCGVQVLADKQNTTAAKFELNLSALLLLLSIEGTAMIGVNPKNRLKGLV